MIPRLDERGSAGDENMSGILTFPRFGVPNGEWNGLDWSLNKGAAMARLDEVLAIRGGGPTAPNGDAERGASAGASFQGSLGENTGGTEERGADTVREYGLNVAALAFSILGDATGEPDEEYPDDDSVPCGMVGDLPESVRERACGGCPNVGV